MSAYRIKVDLVRIHRHFDWTRNCTIPEAVLTSGLAAIAGRIRQGAAGSIAIWLLRVVQPKEADGLGSTVDANGDSVPTRPQHIGCTINLAGLFRISPIVGLKNCYTRLQEGKVIALGN